jgi:hypothetical protein
MTGGPPLLSPTFLLSRPSLRRTHPGAPHLGVRDGTAAPPGRPACRANWRVRSRGFRMGRGYSPFYPCAAPLSGKVCAVEPGATLPNLTVKPEASGEIRTTPRATALQKQEEGQNPSRSSHQPHWGILSPFIFLRPWEKEKREKGRGRFHCLKILPECWPSCRRTAAPRRCEAPR